MGVGLVIPSPRLLLASWRSLKLELEAEHPPRNGDLCGPQRLLICVDYVGGLRLTLLLLPTPLPFRIQITWN